MPKKDFSNIGSYRKNQGTGGGQYRPEKPPEPVTFSDDETLVSLVPLNNILPDPYQSRAGLLPLALMIPVYNGQRSPADALEEWIGALDSSPLYRPRYDELVDLADSIRQYGLVNPIHIYHPPRQVSLYRIESGERRYWAHWLLARQDPTAYGSIRAIIETEFSVYRQIDENEDVAGLSAVGEARNTARLFLTELNIFPALTPSVEADLLYHFYRQVTYPIVDLIGQDYLPDGFWARLADLTRKSRDALNERLDVFKLPAAALEIADAARLNFLQIREILRSEQDEVMAELAELAAVYQLTGAALRKLARLSLDDPEAYQYEVAVIRGQEVRQKRRHGAPLEVQSKRLHQAMRGLERLTDQEYIAIAERLIAADPRTAPAIAESLERLLIALRARQNR